MRAMRICLATLVLTCASFYRCCAAAADEGPSAVNPWDVGFGAAWMTDYNIRGITQSAHRPAAAVYFEPRYTVDPALQVYGGLYGAGVDLPNLTTTQIVYYGGLRPTLGKLAIDFDATAAELE